MDTKKEIRDQLLHFGAGAGATLFLGAILPLFIASLSVAIFAYGREIMQRLSQGDVWYQCGTGCMLDLTVWAAGIFFAAMIHLFVIG